MYTLHLLNLKSQSFEMAETSGFETLNTGSALLKKGTFAEKVEQRAVSVVLEIPHLSATSRTVSRRSPLITSRTSFFTASDSLKDGLPSR
jgi:hypothetical protein